LATDTDTGIELEGGFIAGEAPTGVPQADRSEVDECFEVVDVVDFFEGFGGFGGDEWEVISEEFLDFGLGGRGDEARWGGVGW
jgi:hypothetical protein